MGMFDYVEVDVPLPDGWSSPNYQTKDLECCMNRYKISADGKLLVWEYDEVEDGPPREDTFLKIERQFYKAINKGWEEVKPPYHGHIVFYSSETVGEEPWPDNFATYEGRPPLMPICKWHEYRAKFTDGKLMGIVMVDDAS